MFFEDEAYKIFIQNMRDLLSKEAEFKDRYCANSKMFLFEKNKVQHVLCYTLYYIVCRMLVKN